MTDKRCISCGRGVVDYTEFPSPDTNETIIRCNYCRQNKIKYKTKEGFEGP